MTPPDPDGVGFTVGPWEADAVCFDRKIPIRGGVTAYGRPYVVAHVNRPGSAFSGQDKANAALIAAAPTQHAALTKIVDLARPGQEIGISEAVDILCDIYNEARAALSKARGQ